jgi:hypothetical protein
VIDFDSLTIHHSLGLQLSLDAHISLTKRSSEPRAVLMPSFDSMPTSFLARAVADLVSR